MAIEPVKTADLSGDPHSDSWEAMVLVGRVARPHGIRGQVVVNPETDFVEQRFAVGATLWTRSADRDEQLVIVSSRIQGGRPVIGLEGFSSVEEVERLTGQELRVPERELTSLEPGTYYQHQLVGCTVETIEGERVGEVTRVDGGSGGATLTVTGPRGEVLIPFATDICIRVDVGAKRIRIAPPEGLLELNETRSTRT